MNAKSSASKFGMSTSIFSISFIFQILYLFLKNKIRKRLGEYNMCLTIILYAIKEQTGFEFDKN